MKRYKLFSVIMLVLIISGCIDTGTTTKIESKDLLKINNIEIFPSQTVSPETELTIRMEIENVGQEQVFYLVDNNEHNKDNVDGDALLYDHCPLIYTLDKTIKDSFKVISGKSKYCEENPPTDTKGNPIFEDPTIDGVNIDTGCYSIIRSGDIHMFQWNIKAPSLEKTLGITNKCDFKFQVKYLAKAETNSYIYFADPAEIIQRLYTDKDLSVKGDNIATYGPVAISLETPPQPIPIGGRFTLYFTFKNVGKGIAKLKGTENNFELSSEIDTDDWKTEKKVCKGKINKKDTPIQIYGKDSSRISCSFNAPKISILKPFKFTSEAIYEYGLTETKTVTTLKE
jgi:hypothetical protein